VYVYVETPNTNIQILRAVLVLRTEMSTCNAYISELLLPSATRRRLAVNCGTQETLLLVCVSWSFTLMIVLDSWETSSCVKCSSKIAVFTSLYNGILNSLCVCSSLGWTEIP
jgi:hypothetical protein